MHFAVQKANVTAKKLISEKDFCDQPSTMNSKVPGSIVVGKINKFFLTVAIIDTLIILLIAFAIGIHYNKSEKISCSCSYPNQSQDANSNIIEPVVSDSSPIRIVSRKEWMANPAFNDTPLLEIPSTRVIIIHTATENCTSQASCAFRVRTIQTYHMESRGFDDIAYNFLIGGDGAFYIGRGWNKQGQHTKGWNEKSLAIAFIGTFVKMVPPIRQLFGAQKIIEEGIKMNKLSSDYRLYGHRQLMATESPGSALYEIIKTWDHWSDTVM